MLVIDPSKFKFQIRDEVEKYTGDYQIKGIVVGHVVTLNGKQRYVVEHQPAGFLHIYSEANLRRVEE